MNSENIENQKYLITWWDLVDHYLLAAMLVVSLGSFGLQSTQDRLICLPAVNRSPITAGNDSALRNRSSLSAVSLFKLPDRRHYDYVDNECYAKMDGFSAYYSLIFFAETVILVVISNYWQKYPKSANAIARCEHLVSEYNKGGLSKWDSAKDLAKSLERLIDWSNQETKDRSVQRDNCIKDFSKACSKFIIGEMSWSCVTVQYRLRGFGGSLFASSFLLINIFCYINRREWTRCDLDEVDYATKLKSSFFQCSRTTGSYFHIATILFFVFVIFHLLFTVRSLYWALSRQNLLDRKPRFVETKWGTKGKKEKLVHCSKDTAFLLYLLEASGCYFVKEKREEEFEMIERAPLLTYEIDKHVHISTGSEGFLC
ncbi:volume-regulated anion channel subunit LRRC8C-like [Acropora millepora]|uniref:volume-regulated anion channel subunit LRRC8C-like n=1 Tax=Acropora millepora TaxID=45264 RepID=UPI001CF2BE18|nr:volume-regulated anion channel subunit LRRC8C-like [Acropora millepora]